MQNRPKLLCILHRSPPTHGAAKVGDFIASSKKLNEKFECRFITIKSSETIGEIGKVNFKKLYLVVELYFKVLWVLLTFRPQKIYFTASIRSVALYRDLFVSTLWKSYKLFKPLEIFYHYHTKGVDEYVTSSKLNLKLTRFFLKDVNLVLLSPLLKDDFKRVQTFKKVLYLPNGVEDSFLNNDFEHYIKSKYRVIDSINILFLSNMMKSKGYFDVLKLANETKYKNIKFHFAGGWQNSEDKEEFFQFIKDNQLEEIVTFHGFVSGYEKRELFKKAHFFIFPTKNEAFPLSILEALSFGIPVIATDEGSIPYMIDKKSGIIINDVRELSEALNTAKELLLNKEVASYCRERYLNDFSLEQFENNLINILKGGLTYKTLNVMNYDIFVDNISSIQIDKDRKQVINTINPHSYITAKNDKSFEKALHSSNILLPDGSGIVLATKQIYKKKIKKIAGYDLHIHLLKELEKMKGSVFYMGASQDTLKKIHERIAKEYPHINIGSYSPPYKDVFSSEDNNKIVSKINDFNPDVLFIGMTAPKQEKWLHEHKNILNFKIASCVGAVFNFYAGTVIRPSPFWINLHLEWLPRLIKEPKRLWKRNFISTPLFLEDIILHKLKIKRFF